MSRNVCPAPGSGLKNQKQTNTIGFTLIFRTVMHKTQS